MGGISSFEVHVIGCDVAQGLVVASGVVVVDKDGDFPLQFSGCLPDNEVNPRTGKQWKSPEKAFQRGREDAKLTWVGFHDLRRFRAAPWVRLGLDVETVRKLLGHHDIQTTQLYIKGFETYLEDVRAVQATEQSG